MDILSLEINAVDYIEENKKEELERALKDISGRNEVPKWLPQGSIIGPFFNTQDWGDVKIDNLSDFELVKIHVLICKTLPFVYMVIISGRVSRNLLESSKEKIEIEELQKKFKAQTKVILDKIGGIISSNKNNLTVFGQTCLIVVSFRCDENEIGIPSELGRKRIESQINDAEIKQLNRAIRDREIFTNMRLNCGGLISITNLADNYISFINQRNIVNFQF